MVAHPCSWCVSLRRARFTEVRLLAAHTTSLLNPRAALGWEAQPRGKFDEELHLPGGQSRCPSHADIHSYSGRQTPLKPAS